MIRFLGISCVVRVNKLYRDASWGADSSGTVNSWELKVGREGWSLSHQFREVRAVPGVRFPPAEQRKCTRLDWGVWGCQTDTWANTSRQICPLLLRSLRCQRSVLGLQAQEERGRGSTGEEKVKKRKKETASGEKKAVKDNAGNILYFYCCQHWKATKRPKPTLHKSSFQFFLISLPCQTVSSPFVPIEEVHL